MLIGAGVSKSPRMAGMWVGKTHTAGTGTALAMGGLRQSLQVAAPGSSWHDGERLLEPVSKRDHKGYVTLSNSALQVI